MGGCIVLGFQNFYLIEDIYGSSLSKAISDLTGTKAMFRSMDSDSARKMSACIRGEGSMRKNRKKRL
jgi:type IV secretory pathway TraG/TraD family ATPase VirD4